MEFMLSLKLLLLFIIITISFSHYDVIELDNRADH